MIPATTPRQGRKSSNRWEETMRPAGKWFAALAVFTLCTLAFAAHPPEALSGDSYLLVKAGAYTPQAGDMDNYSTGANAEVAVGHYFLPFLSGELGGGYFESKNGGDKLSVYPLTLAARLRVPLPVVKPYAILGGGAYFTTLDTSAGSKDDTAYGYFAGAGVDFKIAFLLLNIEAKYLWVEPSFSGANKNIEGVVATVGVGVEF
jgi:opacity protein-like surface antigen